MWPDRVSNPGPPTYESGALPIALRGPAVMGYAASREVQPSSAVCIITTSVKDRVLRKFEDITLSVIKSAVTTIQS